MRNYDGMSLGEIRSRIERVVTAYEHALGERGLEYKAEHLKVLRELMVRRLVSEGEDIGFLEDEEVDIDMLKRIANQIPNMSERTAARLYGVLDTEANRDKNGERVEPTNGDALVVYSTTTPFNARRWLNPRRFGETSHRLLEAYLKETGLVE